MSDLEQIYKMLSNSTIGSLLFVLIILGMFLTVFIFYGTIVICKNEISQSKRKIEGYEYLRNSKSDYLKERMLFWYDACKNVNNENGK